MTTFDLGITSVSIPQNLGICAGETSLHEVATMQEGIEHNDEKLTRFLGDPREFLRRLVARIMNRDVHSSSFMAVGSKPWLTVA